MAYLSAAVLVMLFLVVTVIPLAMLVFTSFQPFYDGVNLDGAGPAHAGELSVLLGPGSFRDSIVNTLVLGASTATHRGALYRVVRMAGRAAACRARRLLDHLATLPLVFPAIILSVAFLDVFVNMPLPLYGTLLSVIIASIGALPALWNALRVTPARCRSIPISKRRRRSRARRARRCSGAS